MRIILSLAITLLVACTKQNPDLCCVDEADCANVGLTEPLGCSDGLLCRGNQCIAEVCAASSECDSAAPYCVDPPDGRCQMQCTDDTQCPGFSDDASQTFCEAGACVACRAEMNDCSGATPICSDEGRCVGCTRNDQCGSGVCGDDGVCVDESLIAYVSPSGVATGQCLATAPCQSIIFALGLIPARNFVVIDEGTYTNNATIIVRGTRRLIGRGANAPRLRRSGNGPIVTINAGESSLEFLDIGNAVGSGIENDMEGDGIFCPTGNAATVRVIDSVIHDNQARGIQARRCTVTAIRTQFTKNTDGIVANDSTVTLERCAVFDNTAGVNLDGGTFDVTNNFITRNQNDGLRIFQFDQEAARVEFNTIVDNGGLGLACPVRVLPNNLIARNGFQTDGNCSLPNSIIIETDIVPLKFASPDTVPFDYHLTAGSIAIDAATITTIDRDFDGDTRPSDEPDVGADEFVP